MSRMMETRMKKENKTPSTLRSAPLAGSSDSRWMRYMGASSLVIAMSAPFAAE